jgi:hypothetical protein
MNNNTFATLDLSQLSTITGGANNAAESKLVMSKLNSRFGSEGVVSYIGKPEFISTGRRGIDTVSGKFDTNALEGGDTQRSFTGLVNMNNRKVTGLHTRIIGAE